jgi:hypothetical protein
VTTIGRIGASEKIFCAGSSRSEPETITISGNSVSPWAVRHSRRGASRRSAS